VRILPRVCLEQNAVDADCVLGGGEELGVTRRVAVRPELGVGEPGAGEPLLDAAGLLGAAAVCAEEPAGETAVRAQLEPGTHDIVDAQHLAQRCHVRLERRGREDHGVAELPMAPESCGCVVAQTTRDEGPSELGAEPVESRAVDPAEGGACDLLQSISIAADQGSGECEGLSRECEQELDTGGAPEKRRHAVRTSQSPVDVERGNDRARGWRFGHRRTRLYTRCVTDGPEIFDDLYLGLQAGGALRKQRRGEELTDEEREAIGRWQQMSMWRKGLAVGAFAVGTFGLGFTLGGLVFGRRARKA
jgi:hypothetical protein